MGVNGSRSTSLVCLAPRNTPVETLAEMMVHNSSGVRVVASLAYNPFAREWAVSCSDQGGASQ